MTAARGTGRPVAEDGRMGRGTAIGGHGIVLGNAHRRQQTLRLFPIGAVAMFAVLAVLSCRQAPLNLADRTWNKLQAAEQANHSSVSALVVKARDCYDSAWQVIDRENRRWPFMRRYAPAESLLYQAARLADSAGRVAEPERQQWEQHLGGRIRELQEDLAVMRRRSRDCLGRLMLQPALTAAELRLAVAVRGMESGTVEIAEAAIAKADSAMSDLNELVAREELATERERVLSDYWLKQTVDWSDSTGRRALIVIKSKHRAILLDHGGEAAQFAVDLGYNSGVRKLHSGDAATPEGMYEITKKRDNGSSYYKSLELDYPNTEDRRRYNLALESGRIPYGTGIGDAIAVHGEGGVGEDWTDGCVALTNEDMDYLMARLSVGDWVTIVRHTEMWK
jgi:L,D-peptidoglycan transpeptidase YkuD (ErfK/YbiS/YcfS/YnhG family)